MKQKVCGCIFVLASVLIIMMAAHSDIPEYQDVSVILFLIPLGMYLMFTKKKAMYDLPAYQKAKYKRRTAAWEEPK